MTPVPRNRHLYLIAAVLAMVGLATVAARPPEAPGPRVTAEITAALRGRQAARAAGDRDAFLRYSDDTPAWRRFQEVVWEERLEAQRQLTVREAEGIGRLWRVRAAAGDGERTFIMRRRARGWVTTEPTETELGPQVHKDAAFFRLHYYPRWESEELVDQIAAAAMEIAAAVSLHTAVMPEEVDIYLDQRTADRAAFGRDALARRAVSRQREVHLWSPDSFGWGPRGRTEQVLEDIRQVLAVELLFILPGF